MPSGNGQSERPRVLILGGGFAGVGAANALKDADAEVVLVDRHDYHTFQPLLYQLATGLIETTAVGHSLRDLLGRQKNAVFHQATVTGVDLEAREVRFEDLAPMSYDYLVFGLGAKVNYFGTEGAAEHAFPMYTLPNAVRLKDHLLERWEAVDHDPSLIEDGALNVVVVGGGPTGVETAGAVTELYRAQFVKDYPDIPQDQARVILVEAGPELFSMFKPNLREYATKALTERTVEVRTGDAVASVSPTRVTLKSGDVLEAHTLVWGAGLQGNELVQSLGIELERGNRVGVGPDLTLADHPEVYVRRRHRRDRRLEDRAGAAPAWVRGAPVRRARRRDDRPPDRRQDDQALRLQGQGHDGGDRTLGRMRPVPRWANDDRQEGRAGLADRARGAAADERGPREGRRRLGRRRADTPARRTLHRRRRVGRGARGLNRRPGRARSVQPDGTPSSDPRRRRRRAGRARHRASGSGARRARRRARIATIPAR